MAEVEDATTAEAVTLAGATRPPKSTAPGQTPVSFRVTTSSTGSKRKPRRRSGSKNRQPGQSLGAGEAAGPARSVLQLPPTAVSQTGDHASWRKLSRRTRTRCGESASDDAGDRNHRGASGASDSSNEDIQDIPMTRKTGMQLRPR